MTGSTFVTEVDGGRTVIRVSGIFDRGSAVALREMLDRARGEDVVLDFSLVREFADLGVATLANRLAGAAGQRVALRGLRQHQLRLFRYFGVDLEALPARVEPVPPGAVEEEPVPASPRPPVA